MIKRLIVFTTTIILSFIVFYCINNFFLYKINIFYYPAVYFFVISSLIVYFLIELVFRYMPIKAGYLFLALMFIKLGFSILIFRDFFFIKASISKIEKFSLLVPFIISLLIEVIFVGKLINRQN